MIIFLQGRWIWSKHFIDVYLTPACLSHQPRNSQLLECLHLGKKTEIVHHKMIHEEKKVRNVIAIPGSELNRHNNIFRVHLSAISVQSYWYWTIATIKGS